MSSITSLTILVLAFILFEWSDCKVLSLRKNECKIKDYLLYLINYLDKLKTLQIMVVNATMLLEGTGGLEVMVEVDMEEDMVERMAEDTVEVVMKEIMRAMVMVPTVGRM